MKELKKINNLFESLSCINKPMLESVEQKQNLLFEYINTEGNVFVYNNIKSSSIKDVEQTGYSEEFYATNGGCMYTYGAYTNYKIGQTIAATNSGKYGDTIVKYKVKGGFKNFLFFLNRSKSDFNVPPLHIQLKKFPKLVQLLGESYVNVLQDLCDNSNRSSTICYNMLCKLGGTRHRTELLNSLGVRGLIFYGGNDGPVAIIHNADDLVPIGYVTRPLHGYIDGSTDKEIRWKPIHYSYNDGTEVNAISYFMSQFGGKYEYSKVTRSSQGEILVIDKNTKKYLYLDIQSKSPLFGEYQFDDAEIFDACGKARVKISNEWVWVDKEGNLYDEKNDKEPISTLEIMFTQDSYTDEELDDLF